MHIPLLALAVIGLLAGLAVLGAFIGGIAYARRELRRDPEGFARDVAKFKSIAPEVRERWRVVAELVERAKLSQG